MWLSYPTAEFWWLMAWTIIVSSFWTATGIICQSLEGAGTGPVNSMAFTRWDGPGQFNGIHALGIGPDGLIFALDRSGGRVNVFRTTDDPKEVEFVDVWGGFGLTLDIIVNEDSIWITTLGPLRFVKMDFEGKRLYTWNVPRALPNGYLEVHTFTVDADGNLYGGDNQYGRTQKFVPKPGADPELIIGTPWVAR